MSSSVHQEPDATPAALTTGDLKEHESVPEIDRPRKGRKAVNDGKGAVKFAGRQLEILREQLSSWEATIIRYDPKYSVEKCPSEITAWKNVKVDELMKREDFIEGFGNDLTGLRVRTGKWFDNQKGTLKARYSRARLQAQGSQPSGSDQANDAKETQTEIKFAAALMDIQLPARTGKEIFLSERKAEINELAKKLLPETPGCHAAAHQKAAARMWKEADREEWEAKVGKEDIDIHGNQAVLHRVLYRGLQSLCEGGLFGSLEMAVFYGYRNREDNQEGGMAHVSTINKGSSEPFIAHVGEAKYKELKQLWSDWSDRALPSIHDTISFPRNDEGLPLFLPVDPNRMTGEDVRTVLKQYLCAVWAFAWPRDAAMPSPPWTGIASRPDQFFDNQIHPLPVTLNDPDSQLSFPHVSALVEHFLITSTPGNPNPFRFFPRSYILAHSMIEDPLFTEEAPRVPSGESAAEETTIPAAGQADLTSAPVTATSRSFSPSAAIEEAERGKNGHHRDQSQQPQAHASHVSALSGKTQPSSVSGINSGIIQQGITPGLQTCGTGGARASIITPPSLAVPAASTSPDTDLPVGTDLESMARGVENVHAGGNENGNQKPAPHAAPKRLTRAALKQSSEPVKVASGGAHAAASKKRARELDVRTADGRLGIIKRKLGTDGGGHFVAIGTSTKEWLWDDEFTILSERVKDVSRR